MNMKKLDVHQVGNLSMENTPDVLPLISGGQVVDVQLTTNSDGRFWINVNGISFFRFKPMPKVNK